jgi:hypothetical protein
MPDEITFQNDPVVRLAEPAQQTGELDWDGAREWRAA